MRCPKCGKEVKKINGMYVCPEGHMSTAEAVQEQARDVSDVFGDIFGSDLFKGEPK